MARHFEFVAGVGLLALILAGTAWSIPQLDGEIARGQGSEGGLTPELTLRSQLDLEILAVCLGDDDLRSGIEFKLDAGLGCRHLGMRKDVTYSNGHRDYSGCAAFVPSGSVVDVIRWDYEYKNMATSPALPPDSMSQYEENPTGVTGLENVILPDSVSYEFLVDEVLADPPQGMIDLLDTHDLRELWVEKLGTSSVVYRMYLKYVDANDNTRTEMIWAAYSTGVFGVRDSTF